MNAAQESRMAIAAERSEMTLTRDEHSLLVEASVRERGKDKTILAGLVLSAIAGVAIVITSVYYGIHDRSVLGFFLIANAALLWESNKRRNIAASLVRKPQGDPHQGRRAIDTAIPYELSQN
jgi:hypothetical protein